MDGSRITIQTGGSAAVSVGDLPNGTTISSISDGGVRASSGVLWSSVSGLPATVSFRLTPPTYYQSGDTIALTVGGAGEETTTTLQVTEPAQPSDGSDSGDGPSPAIPDGFPLTDVQYQAVDANNDGQISQIELAKAESSAVKNGEVNGVAFTTIEFAQLKNFVRQNNSDDGSAPTNGSSPDDGSAPTNGTAPDDGSGSDDGADSGSSDDEETTGSSGPVVEDSIQLGGSTVTINGGSVSAIGVNKIPDGYYPPADISDGGSLQSGDNGIIWQTGGTVSFNLTPPETASEGDTVTFDVKLGAQEAQPVTLDVVEEPAAPPTFPAEAKQYNAILGDNYDSVSTFALVDAIEGASDDGEYNGASFSTFDFVDIIEWNSGNP